jgi:hypothetical protein
MSEIFSTDAHGSMIRRKDKPMLLSKTMANKRLLTTDSQ